jgi:hypothetical protein
VVIFSPALFWGEGMRSLFNVKTEEKRTNPLFEFSQQFYSADQGTKPPAYYLRYDEVFRNKDFIPRTMLEVGVHMGESTKVFSSVYPDLSIVAVDLKTYDIDFSDYPRVTYLQADQSDQLNLRSICEKHFPDGIDLVIDDASHIGYLSKLTFDAVFPYVKKGGLYIVEDWGTGYWDDWPDGSRYQEFPVTMHDGHLPKRISSHDCGMVGFVKSLVDLTGEDDIRPAQAAPRLHAHRVRTLEVSPGICIAQKA